MSTIRYTTNSGVDLKHGHPGDAGIDLPASERIRIVEGAWVNVPCDVCIELPPGTWASIVGRSSTFFKKHLIVNSAVIDNGYRGELFVCVFNAGHNPYTVEVGERLAQLVPMLLVPVELKRVGELGQSVRGRLGFGSTG
jgi:dUTP pyrophosphatase